MNEGVERAHRDGILTAASLMVGGAAAADAVRRARSMPSLRLGLHLVVVEGPGVLRPPPNPLPGGEGEGEGVTFPSDQLGLALRYAFRPAARRRLAAEIRAQFAAFAATGLALDHADAHKHMHLHPVVGGLLVRIGREFGLRSVRVPAEPRVVGGIGSGALRAWTRVLRGQVRRAGMVANDHAFGIAWSGHMTADKLLRLAPRLPDGLSEIYFHPAARRDALLAALMPDYEHEAELAALLDPRVRAAFVHSGAMMTSYGEEVSRWNR